MNADSFWWTKSWQKRSYKIRLILSRARELRVLQKAVKVLHQDTTGFLEHYSTESIRRTEDFVSKAARSQKVEVENRSIKSNAAYRRRVDNLENPYLKLLLTKGTNLSLEDFPPELVELKRKAIMLTRRIREKETK